MTSEEDDSATSTHNDPQSALGCLHGEFLHQSLQFLDWRQIVSVRRVSSSWNHAVSETVVEEQIDVPTRQVLRLIQKSLPNLHSLSFDQRTDPDILLQEDDDYHDEKENDADDVNGLVIQQFFELRHFRCVHAHPSPLRNINLSNLFRHWPYLQSLNLHGNEDLEWNLSDLSSLTHLKDIRLINNYHLRGDTWDLFHKKDEDSNDDEQWVPTALYYNLEILDISGCTLVTGRLRHFANLPKLQWLGINRTGVKGDLRTDIRRGEFSSLQGIGLCSRSVYGANTIDSVADAHSVMKARLQIMKQSKWESPIWPLMVYLSPESPDYHERPEQRLYTSERDPPFSIEVVLVAGRFGWRWSNYLGGFCDTHWVDPEPDRETHENGSDYWDEITAFQAQTSMFSGFLDPPTPQEYRQLCEDHTVRESTRI
ncbi:hypothetical protein IV203_006920 [Nitzschia inconspicua]|uniref:F-box domain-containing protein n=1 Tax=Nitzschia inconspicua TaxID=303405 RepID=A0A9K3KDY3_9STRA|nr:hypothetical protein IV203_006920 [Nitzschia inconspicua]